jgi:phosphatidylglycerol---prolipoprotein diacylglyceryl transferase
VTPLVPPATTGPGFPPYFTIAGFRIHSYKVSLIVGIYVASLAVAALGASSGLSPLRMGLATMACALAGVFGARAYHLLVHAAHYRREASWRALWDGRRGGMNVLGALPTVVPGTVAVAWLLELPAHVVWDHMSSGVLAGGFWVRLGCVLNGCCGGRETRSPLGVRLHDVRGVTKRRVPVQFMEMAWWFLGAAAFLRTWPLELPPGSYALAVLAWYGTGRFFLEPLRERSDLVRGLRIDRVVAGLLALSAGSALLLRGVPP